MSLANLTSGLPGLFADQEYGLLASAPVLALAVVGWWRLWRRDAAGRRATLTTLVPFGILALTTGAFELWWGGTAPPGRELVAAVPLLAVPLAWAWQSSEDARVQRASLEWLVGVGLAMTCTLVFVHRRPARRQHAGWGLRAARIPRSGASARPRGAVVRRRARRPHRAGPADAALGGRRGGRLARSARVRRVDTRHCAARGLGPGRSRPADRGDRRPGRGPGRHDAAGASRVPCLGRSAGSV